MLKKAIETPEKNSLSDIETDFVNHAIEKSKEIIEKKELLSTRSF